MVRSKLEVLSKSRQYVRQRTTKLCNKVNTELSVLTSQERSLHLDRLQSFKERIERIE